MDGCRLTGLETDVELRAARATAEGEADQPQ